jgi:hypothetical protein
MPVIDLDGALWATIAERLVKAFGVLPSDPPCNGISASAKLPKLLLLEAEATFDEAVLLGCIGPEEVLPRQ